MRVSTIALLTCLGVSCFLIGGTGLVAGQGKAPQVPGEKNANKKMPAEKGVARLPCLLTVFLLRHAEKIDESRDPGLSKRGLERSKSLARMLGKARVTHLFSSEYTRTSATLKYLAKARGLSITKISARTPEKQIAALDALPPGAIAVIAGHSNTIPKLCKALGGASYSTLPDTKIAHDSYDRLFMITLPRGAAAKVVSPQCIELRYGASPE